MIDYKHKVIYQVWPRSFKDSNDDGIGDIQGIISKLDYLKLLGIDVIWLSPLYESPNDDYGYDISNYYKIAEEYGTMDDFNLLVEECKKRNIDILMDLVANHTSTKHAWFVDALNNPSSKYRDYYFFKHGKNNKQPNNWLSFFGGSTWQKESEVDNSYYLTTFAPTQADLNWENENVRLAIYDVMKFYLEKGVIGFRMDVINTIDKKHDLPDYMLEKKGLQFPKEYIIDGPKVHTYLKEMRKMVLDPYNAIALGECVMVSKEAAMNYTNPINKEIDMTFHFELSMLGYGELGKYDCRKAYHFTIKEFKAITRKWQNAMLFDHGYIGNYLSNHDHQRHLNRFGDVKNHYSESAKALALYNFSLMGTPFIYQGEEIGMTNPKLPYSEWKDYEAINSVNTMSEMLHIPLPIAKWIGQKVTRDNARGPVQWSNETNAGFSKHQPWMMLNNNYQRINVEANLKDPDSIFHFYQKLINLRTKYPALSDGDFEELLLDHNKVLAFIRTYQDQSLLIITNLSKKNTNINLNYKNAECIISNYSPISIINAVSLPPFYSAIYLLNKS